MGQAGHAQHVRQSVQGILKSNDAGWESSVDTDAGYWYVPDLDIAI